jgi:hypothetical protein
MGLSGIQYSPSVEPFGLPRPRSTTASQARRDASHPALLRTSPHIHVRSFERIALTPTRLAEFEHGRSSIRCAIHGARGSHTAQHRLPFLKMLGCV